MDKLAPVRPPPQKYWFRNKIPEYVENCCSHVRPANYKPPPSPSHQLTTPMERRRAPTPQFITLRQPLPREHLAASSRVRTPSPNPYLMDSRNPNKNASRNDSRNNSRNGSRSNSRNGSRNGSRPNSVSKKNDTASKHKEDIRLPHLETTRALVGEARPNSVTRAQRTYDQHGFTERIHPVYGKLGENETEYVVDRMKIPSRVAIERCPAPRPPKPKVKKQPPTRFDAVIEKKSFALPTVQRPSGFQLRGGAHRLPPIDMKASEMTKKKLIDRRRAVQGKIWEQEVQKLRSCAASRGREARNERLLPTTGFRISTLILYFTTNILRILFFYGDIRHDDFVLSSCFQI